MNCTTSGIHKKGLPEGFVYIDELIEDAVIDAKYAGTDNFMGRPAAGYNAPLVVCCTELAVKLVQAADILREKGYILKLFDSYRPQSAVDDFIKWGEDETDIRRKPIQYPHLTKKGVFDGGYIAERSGHTRAKAIDLTIVYADTMLEVDMDSIFDYMDTRSNYDVPGLTAEQEANRMLLCGVMESVGLKRFHGEWWHFNLDPEPYPDTFFNFPIE